MIASDPKGSLVFIFIMEEVIIFIDGAYLSLISKYLGKGKPLRFDIKKFALMLARKEKFYCKEIFYYNCPPFQSSLPTEEEIKKKTGYDKFINKLKNLGLKIREGRCQRIGEEFSQKGADTLMTIDLVRKATETKIKNFILVTSDTDFVPVIKDIRKNDKIRVIIYYFKDFIKDSIFSMSDHILDICDKKVLFKKEDFENLHIDN